eukprot:6179393-Pleurochrysis_carterae.AAC.2
MRSDFLTTGLAEPLLLARDDAGDCSGSSHGVVLRRPHATCRRVTCMASHTRPHTHARAAPHARPRTEGPPRTECASGFNDPPEALCRNSCPFESAQRPTT